MDISIDGEQQPRVIIDLLPHLAPRACENFRVLMRAQPGRGYRHTLFHEVSPGLHACAGLFTGESVFGGRFRDEICMEQPGYERYNVFMANTGPNSNNIEFFIALGENDFRTLVTLSLSFLANVSRYTTTNTTFSSVMLQSTANTSH